MSDYGIRRPKRMRSPSFANSSLEAELQSSIRSQSHVAKRSKTSARRPSTRTLLSAESGTVPAAAAALEADFHQDFAVVRRRQTRTPAAATPKESHGSKRSIWGSMSGFFSKERRPSASVRETLDAYGAPNTFDRRPASKNSARDSGVYLDSRPSSRPLDDASSLPKLSLGPSIKLEAPSTCATPDASESPLKRLQTASINGLRRIRSLALKPQPSREASPAKDQTSLLMEKMTSLQSQLDQCKEELAELAGESAKLDRPAHSTSVARNEDSQSKEPKKRRSLVQSETKPISSVEPMDEFAPNWPMKAMARGEGSPESLGDTSLHRKAASSSLRTPEPVLKTSEMSPAGAADCVPATDGDDNYARRSLSTIESSGDEQSPTETGGKAKEKGEAAATPASTVALSRSMSIKSRRGSRAATRQTSQKFDAAGNKTNHSVTRSNVNTMTDSIDQHDSPRISQARARRVGSKGHAGSIGQKGSLKKVGSDTLGSYDENGEWTWTEEAF